MQNLASSLSHVSKKIFCNVAVFIDKTFENIHAAKKLTQYSTGKNIERMKLAQPLQNSLRKKLKSIVRIIMSATHYPS